ncbi:MAG: PQQ-binding-like beta-propeller repeat protein [Planctomycetaceae bacterium]|nr:PQQ-binding-like beta-propeller repeat protein [Planctomycetaceae bacterium]
MIPRAAFCLSLVLMAAAAAPLPGQLAERASALPPAEIDELDSASAAHLESAKRFLGQQQWEEAVESIRRVQEADHAKLVRVEMARKVAGFQRWAPATEYCQWRLAALAKEAPPALAHYRQLVDALAEQWYRDGIANRDARPLTRVVEQTFASRWGDDALLSLGDLALERGQPAAARAFWRRIRPELGPPSDDIFPDSDLAAADVRARLVLASIMEGSLSRARGELAALEQEAPQAEGTIGGLRGSYKALLTAAISEAEKWPAIRQSAGWPTLAGNEQRDKHGAGGLEIAGRPLWTFALPKLHADRELIGAGRLRVADDGKALLSYHPVVVGETVLVRCDARRKSYVIALNLKTGEELWRVDYRRVVRQRPGDESEQPPDESPFEVSDAHADLARHVGVARYTASVADQRAFVRMGSPITSPGQIRRSRWLAKDQGFLLGLDLRTQGKPLEGFPIRPEAANWSFEGTPISDGSLLYVAMRRTDGARSQLYVAALELQTTAAAVDDDDDDARPTGRMKWRTRICSAATLLDSDNGDGLSHLLLSLRDGELYFNTNAGVVAAIRASDGQIRWVVKYPRTAPGSGDPDQSSGQFFRDLNPCLVWKDLVVVAPSDSDRIFALKAATGQLAWALPPGAAADAVHLLGVGQDTLLASGDWLYWIDAQTGRLLAQFPQAGPTGAAQAAPSPRGFGRGILAGDLVYFPTRESILVFDQRPTRTDFGWQPQLVREIPLVPRGATGGNLVIANGVLLIATGDRLMAFGE